MGKFSRKAPNIKACRDVTTISLQHMKVLSGEEYAMAGKEEREKK